jgi:hypothetical protein
MSDPTKFITSTASDILTPMLAPLEDRGDAASLRFTAALLQRPIVTDRTVSQS